MEGAHIPGNRRYANRARHLVDGISIKESVYDSCIEFTKGVK
jgi:delta1-piperideine-2-carboxylate reductase